MSQAPSPQSSQPGVQPGYSTTPSGYSTTPPGYISQPGVQAGRPMDQTMMRGPASGYGIDPKTGLPYSHRSKLVAGLLQIFLGGFGVGRFYTGHVGIAIAQIAVTIFTCGFGALWPLIDGIMFLVGESPKDVDGKPLRPG